MTRFRRPGKTIDYKQWDILLGLSASISANVLLGGGILNFLEPATILRIVCGGALVMFDATKQVGDGADFGYALGVVSSDAAASGVGALPDPLSEAEYPWLYWHTFHLEAQVAAGEEGLGSSVYRMPAFDSGSMRKMKPGQALVMLLDCGGFQGAPVTVIELEPCRVLIGT